MLRWSEGWFGMRRRGREKEEVGIERRWYKSVNGSERTMLTRLGLRGETRMCVRVCVEDG